MSEIPSPTRELVLRRRSPKRVRNMTSAVLHALTLRLIRQFQDGRITVGQTWLMDCCISELEYRARDARRWSWKAPCRCELCAEPGQSSTDLSDAGEPLGPVGGT